MIFSQAWPPRICCLRASLLPERKARSLPTHGSLFVRYRPAPLAIEVVALGREQRDGPAILVRVPDDNSKEGGASLFHGDPPQ